MNKTISLDFDSFDRWLRELTRQEHSGSVVSLIGSCNSTGVLL